MDSPFNAKAIANKMVLESYGTLSNEILTEDACALAFTQQYADRLRYDHDAGKWYVWDGSIWRPNNTCAAFQYARETIRQMAAREEKDRIRFVLSKVSFAAGVERFAKSDPHFAVTNEHWNQDMYLLGTPSGTVNLKTGDLSKSNPRDAISKSTSVAPSNIADCPIFRRFLDETFSSDHAVISFVQQFLGYSLTGDTREQIFVFGHGDGGNGKGVLVNTVKEILGDYAKQATMESLTASKHERHTTDIAMLAGARFVTASETERGRSWAEKTVCALTGGDPISARFMRQDNFEFIPQFKLCIIGNHKPRLTSVTPAMRRRLKMLPFLNKPQKPDPELIGKLKNEHPAILRLMIEGCLDWQKNGFTDSPAINAATDEYFQEEDLFGQWLSEECEVDPGNEYKTATSAELFSAWKAYLTKLGQDTTPWNSTSFAIEMKKHAERKRTRTVSVWLGIRLAKKASYYDTDS